MGLCKTFNRYPIALSYTGRIMSGTNQGWSFKAELTAKVRVVMQGLQRRRQIFVLEFIRHNRDGVPWQIAQRAVVIDNRGHAVSQAIEYRLGRLSTRVRP